MLSEPDSSKNYITMYITLYYVMYILCIYMHVYVPGSRPPPTHGHDTLVQPPLPPVVWCVGGITYRYANHTNQAHITR